MSAAKLTLYVDSSFTSPYALSTFVTLTEKHLPFELKTLDLDKGEQKRPEFRGPSLTGRIPTLVHNDFWLSESSAICEYLDEAFPGPTYVAAYPKDIHLRARARQVQGWLRSDLAVVREERPTTVIFEKPSVIPLSEKARLAVEKLLAAADSLLRDDAQHLFGEWSIADTELALILNRLVANGDAVPAKLATYTRKQWERPSVQAWLTRRSAKT